MFDYEGQFLQRKKKSYFILYSCHEFKKMKEREILFLIPVIKVKIKFEQKHKTKN